MNRTLNAISSRPIVFGRQHWKSTRRVRAITFLALCFVIGCVGGELAVWIHHVAPVWPGE